MEYTIYENEKMSFSQYLSKCFFWMFFGLLTSFGVSVFFAYTGLFARIFMSLGTTFTFILAIVEIILVISLSRSVFNLDSSKAKTLFFVYSALNGMTLSSIFYLYDMTSIIYVFLGAASIFGIMSVVGYKTKLDLSKLRNFISISLVSVLLISVVMLFAYNSFALLVLSLIIIGLFMIITTYDIHVIKRMYYQTKSVEEQNALAIYGALQLYLDFINIFIHLLRIFARSRD